MSKRTKRIAEVAESFRGKEHGLDGRYLGFFDCFNKQRFFEAHEVLEDLWLRTKGENYSFYKGLIQLAGAFVHIQKGRLQPAGALFRLAKGNLEKFPALHEQLDVSTVLRIITEWLCDLQDGKNKLLTRWPASAPGLRLQASDRPD